MSTPPTDAKSIFGQALELTDPAARAAFLDAACAGNPALRAEVEGLLAALDRAGGFLGDPRVGDGPTADTAPEAGTAPFERAAPGGTRTTDHAGRDEAVGAVVAGKYKLVEEVGEGGMGSVFLAQQTEPVRRLVAVKVIKAGMDSKQVIARFDAERQALAMMDHPNIAKVLDAGTTEAGRPFFVMELVKGVPITRFCDERKLTPRERLGLFVPVCLAIQHAHQKGVIHRDIKPSNVLVSLYDDRPVPKVIDFGVAKATGPQLTEYTMVTGLGAVVGTPEYMSPEQASFNQLDVDTRSDIYSLGVLLYELLTGTTPLDRMSLGRAALLEVLRMVREVEAPRPSTKLSSSDVLPIISANRGTEPRRLAGLLRGELDWIVMKALEKDRSRRYETANGFAADVQRYLAGEPVLAVPPSAGYRLRKFLRKHRGPVTAAGVVLLALVAGVIGTAWGLVEARDQRDAAEAAREREAGERAKVEDRERLLGEKTRLLEEQKKDAEDARRDADLELHDNQRVLLRQAWDAGDTPKLRAVLDQMRPRPGKTDLRGFETHYLDRAAHAEIGRLAVPTPPQPGIGPQVNDWWSPGRWLYQARLAENGHYQTITALDLATGHPAAGFAPIRIRWDNKQVVPQVNVIPGDPPRLWTAGHTAYDPEYSAYGGGLGEYVQIGVWDARTGRPLASCERLLPDAGLVAQGWRHRFLNLCYTAETANRDATVVITQLVKGEKSPDGTTAGIESRAQLHDFKTGKAFRCLDPRPGILERAQFSFDDRYVVTVHKQIKVGGKDSYTCTVWDATTWAVVWSRDTENFLRGFTRDGRAVAFGVGSDPNDKRRRAKEAWDLATGKWFDPPPAIDVSTRRLPAAGLAAATIDNKLDVRDARSGLLLDTLPDAAGPAGAVLATRYWSGDRGELSFAVQTLGGWTVSTYRPPRAEPLAALEAGEGRHWQLRRRPDGGARFECVSQPLDPQTKKQGAEWFEVFDPATRTSRRVELTSPLFKDRYVVPDHVAVAGRTVVVPVRYSEPVPGEPRFVVFTCRLAVYDLETGRERFVSAVTDSARLPPGRLLGEPAEYAVSPDGNRIVACDLAKKRLLCLDARSGHQLWDVPHPGVGAWRAAPLFLPDGKRLILTDEAGTLSLLDAADGRVVKQAAGGPKEEDEDLKLFDDHVPCALTPDGSALYFDGGGVLVLVNTADLTVRHRLGKKRSPGDDLTVLDSMGSPWKGVDDRFAVLHSPAGVQVWDVQSGRRVNEFELSGDKTPGRRRQLHQCLFNGDASRAFVLADGGIHVVDLRRNREVLVLSGVGNGDSSHLSLSADGRELTVTSLHSGSGTVVKQVFDARPVTEEELALAKRLDGVRPPAPPKGTGESKADKQPVTASDYFDLARRSQGKDAVAAYRAAIELEPNFPPLHSGLAEVLQNSGDPDGAVAAYRRAVELQPRDFVSRFQIGLILEGKRDFRGAAAAHREALAADTRKPTDAGAEVFGHNPGGMPARAWMHDKLGDALAAAGDLAEAEKEYREALRLVSGEKEFIQAMGQYPRPTMYATDLAACLIRQGRSKEAGAEVEAHVKRVAGLVKKDDSNFAWTTRQLAQALTDVGWAFVGGGAFAEAVDWSDRAIKAWDEFYKQWPDPSGTDPGPQRAHFHRAIALNALDRGPEAVEAIDRSIRLVQGEEKRKQQMMRARYVAKSGDHAASAKAARELLASPYTGGYPEWYYWDAALAFALNSRTAKDDEKLRAEYAAEAMALLTRSVKAGFGDIPALKKDADLDPIRDRDDFKALLAELEERFPPVRASAPPPREKN